MRQIWGCFKSCAQPCASHSLLAYRPALWLTPAPMAVSLAPALLLSGALTRALTCAGSSVSDKPRAQLQLFAQKSCWKGSLSLSGYIHFHDIYTDTIFFKSSVLLPGQTELSQHFTLDMEGTLPAQPLCVLKPKKGISSFQQLTSHLGGHVKKSPIRVSSD